MAPFLSIFAIMIPIVILIVLRAKGAIEFTSPSFLASASILLGAIGVLVSLIEVAGSSSETIMIGILNAGSVLFGTGMISLAILQKKR